MKNTGYITLGVIILLSCLMMFTFADDIAKAVQAIEFNAMTVYNGKEAELGAKPYLIGDTEYLPAKALAELLNKDIIINRQAQRIYISDKPDTEKNILKAALAEKEKGIAELKEKLERLEADAGVEKRLSISALQDQINEDLGEYEDLSYRVILSGNEDEVRVKIEVDLDINREGWSKLTNSGRKEMLEQICNCILGEYGFVRINGYIKDISNSRKLMTFFNDYKGDIVIGNYKNYSTISVLEDKFNNSYDKYFKDIHFTYGLKGNENRMEFIVYIQKSRYEQKWDRLTDNNIKIFMKKLCTEIQKDEFVRSYIVGYVYDTDSGSHLASCELNTDRDFSFSRE